MKGCLGLLSSFAMIGCGGGSAVEPAPAPAAAASALNEKQECDFAGDGAAIALPSDPFELLGGGVEVLDPGGEPRRLLEPTAVPGSRREWRLSYGMWVSMAGDELRTPVATLEVDGEVEPGDAAGVRVAFSNLEVPHDPDDSISEAMGDGLRRLLAPITEKPLVIDLAVPHAFASGSDPAEASMVWALVPVPASPVGVGARWQVVSRIKGSPSMDADTQYVYSDDRNGEAVIEVKQTIRLDPTSPRRFRGGGGALVQARLMDIDATATVVLAPDFPLGTYESDMITRTIYEECRDGVLEESETRIELRLRLEPRP